MQLTKNFLINKMSNNIFQICHVPDFNEYDDWRIIINIATGRTTVEYNEQLLITPDSTMLAQRILHHVTKYPESVQEAYDTYKLRKENPLEYYTTPENERRANYK